MTGLYNPADCLRWAYSKDRNVAINLPSIWISWVLINTLAFINLDINILVIILKKSLLSRTIFIFQFVIINYCTFIVFIFINKCIIAFVCFFSAKSNRIYLFIWRKKLRLNLPKSSEIFLSDNQSLHWDTCEW